MRPLVLGQGGLGMMMVVDTADELSDEGGPETFVVEDRCTHVWNERAKQWESRQTNVHITTPVNYNHAGFRGTIWSHWPITKTRLQTARNRLNTLANHNAHRCIRTTTALPDFTGVLDALKKASIYYNPVVEKSGGDPVGKILTEDSAFLTYETLGTHTTYPHRILEEMGLRQDADRNYIVDVDNECIQISICDHVDQAVALGPYPAIKESTLESESISVTLFNGNAVSFASNIRIKELRQIKIQPGDAHNPTGTTDTEATLDKAETVGSASSCYFSDVTTLINGDTELKETLQYFDADAYNPQWASVFIDGYTWDITYETDTVQYFLATPWNTYANNYHAAWKYGDNTYSPGALYIVNRSNVDENGHYWGGCYLNIRFYANVQICSDGTLWFGDYGRTMSHDYTEPYPGQREYTYIPIEGLFTRRLKEDFGIDPNADPDGTLFYRTPCINGYHTASAVTINGTTYPNQNTDWIYGTTWPGFLLYCQEALTNLVKYINQAIDEYNKLSSNKLQHVTAPTITEFNDFENDQLGSDDLDTFEPYYVKKSQIDPLYAPLNTMKNGVESARWIPVWIDA